MTRIVAAAIVAIFLIPTTSEAKSRKYSKPVQHRVIRDVTPLFANKTTTQLSARRHRHASSRGGACDGFQRCRCGVTAAQLHGLPLNYGGRNMKLAASYYTFPRTSCHAGAVGIPHAHHVYTVVQCHGDGTATVHDEKGIYRRNVAGNTFVSLDGNGNIAERSNTRSAARTHYASRHHRYRVASAQYYQFAPSDYMERATANR